MNIITQIQSHMGEINRQLATILRTVDANGVSCNRFPTASLDEQVDEARFLIKKIEGIIHQR